MEQKIIDVRGTSFQRKRLNDGSNITRVNLGTRLNSFHATIADLALVSLRKQAHKSSNNKRKTLKKLKNTFLLSKFTQSNKLTN